MANDSLERPAVLAILAKHARAWFERKDLLEKIEAAQAKLPDLEERIKDCITALRLFGLDATDGAVWQKLVDSYKDELQPFLRPWISEDEELVAEGTAETDPPTPLIPPPTDEAPPIAEIVVDRLKEAGEAGSKAAPIREYIEKTYRITIHEKTVGMTLYRLLRKGHVRREGHKWFFVPPEAETENPGVTAPGHINRLFDD